VCEDLRAVALDMLDELNAAPAARQELAQPMLALEERKGADVDAVELALSEQQRCVRGQHRSPNLKLRLGHKSMPLGQCGRASALVNVTGDEMALLIEMVVDLRVN
jgi:hypothetical protein